MTSPAAPERPTEGQRHPKGKIALDDPQFSVLMVCTANICRSPMAQFFLRAEVSRHPALAEVWRVESAGTHASGGAAMHPLAEAVLTERDVPHAQFRTRPLTEEAISDADLILTAAREHRRRVVELAPSAVRRTFTLRQFARLVAAVPELGGPGTDRGAELLAGVPLARSLVPATHAGDDDVADPMGGRIKAFRRCADLVQQAVTEIVTR